jgi:hypothetical protein
MSKLDTSIAKAHAFAHFIGPLLFMIGIAMYLLGIGSNSDGFSSYVEGVFGVYAMMFFVMIHISTARLIGNEKPMYGNFLYLIGIMAACGGVFATSYRIVIGSLDKSGMPAETMVRYMSERETHWEMLVMAPATVAVPVITVLFGIAISRLKNNPFNKLVGPTLIIGGISFLVAQGTETDWGLTYFYPLSGICWMVAYGSMGLKYLRSGTN